MIVNEKKYPALKKLKDGMLGVTAVRQEDMESLYHLRMSSKRLTQCFKDKVADFGREIFVVSKSFRESMFEVKDSLMGLYKETVLNNTLTLDISGTFLIGDFVYFCDYHIKDDSDKHRVSLYVFTKNAEMVMFFEDDYVFEKSLIGWCSQRYIEKMKTLNLSTEKMSIGEVVHRAVAIEIAQIVLVEMFRKYARVETRYVPPMDSKRAECGEPVFNNTNIPCTYLDSKWFTNIVKSQGFSVKGHFRLQPKKINGEWSKELIWVNSFEKQGYNSKAKILKKES